MKRAQKLKKKVYDRLIHNGGVPILVDYSKISTRASRRRAMKREIVEECSKIEGMTYRKARRYVREELGEKSSLNNMHKAIVGVQPC